MWRLNRSNPMRDSPTQRSVNTVSYRRSHMSGVSDARYRHRSAGVSVESGGHNPGGSCSMWSKRFRMPCMCALDTLTRQLDMASPMR